MMGYKRSVMSHLGIVMMPNEDLFEASTRLHFIKSLAVTIEVKKIIGK